MKMMKRSVIIGDENMSNLTTSQSGDASASSVSRNNETTTNDFLYSQHSFPSTSQQQAQAQAQAQPPPKKKKSLPGNPDPDAEVIALSPKSLLATNRFVCEICNKGFQRDQNLQLHRRGHNLPWKLKQRNNKEVIRKKVYVCPEVSCVHHDPSRALGDLTGIKKHFCRKHGEKKWKCDKCSKRYAVQSDWKAHSKICGTKEYRCDCGTLFSRRDSFITHRAFCDALTEEINAKTNPNPSFLSSSSSSFQNINHILHSFAPIKNEPPQHQQQQQQHNIIPSWLNIDHGTTLNLPHSSSSSTPLMFLSSSNLNSLDPTSLSLLAPTTGHDHHIHPYHQNPNPSSTSSSTTPLLAVPFQTHHHGSSSSASPIMSATALLQKASQMGVVTSTQQQHQQHQAASSSSIMRSREEHHQMLQLVPNDKDVTTDFLGGLSGFSSNGDEFVNVGVGVGCGGFELMSSPCSTTNDGKQNI